MAYLYLNIQTVAPTTGSTVLIPDSDAGNLLIVNPATDLAVLTVNPPPNPYNGQVVRVLCTKNIASFTISGGATNYNPGSLNAGGFLRYTYDASNLVWMDEGHDDTNQIATLVALYRGKPFTVTLGSGGTSVVYLTDTGLSTGTALFSAVDYVHLDFVSNDPNFGKSYTLSTDLKTLTVTGVKQAFTGITLLSTNILGSVAISAAVTGTQLNCIVVGKLK